MPNTPEEDRLVKEAMNPLSKLYALGNLKLMKTMTKQAFSMPMVRTGRRQQQPQFDQAQTSLKDDICAAYFQGRFSQSLVAHWPFVDNDGLGRVMARRHGGIGVTRVCHRCLAAA